MTKNILNIKKHNTDNFRDIYEMNFNYVYSFVFSRVAANKEITEDIVQETFTNALKAWNSYSCNSSYKTWLCGIAKNIIFNFYRSSIKKEHVSYDEAIDEAVNTYDVELKIINNESRDIILKSINKLKSVYKYVLILKYMDDYSIKEIAKFLCKTPKSIDGILQRAKISFKKEYIKLSGDDLSEK